MKLILDFIPNHTSRNHSWFMSSAKNELGYANFYIWHPGLKADDGTSLPPNNWVSWICVIFCFYTVVVFTLLHSRYESEVLRSACLSVCVYPLKLQQWLGRSLSTVQYVMYFWFCRFTADMSLLTVMTAFGLHGEWVGIAHCSLHHSGLAIRIVWQVIQ